MYETFALAGGILAILGLLAAIYRAAIWIKGLNDLVQHELRPNSGSSIKDEQKHQIELLKTIKDEMAEDRRTNIEWQQGVMLTLGNHDGRLTGLENKK